MKMKLSGALLLTLLVLVLALAATGPLPLTAQQPSRPVTISKTVRPELINPRGYGPPDRATITITIRGDPLAPAEVRLPLDLVLLIDRSATMDITQIRAAVAQILELLEPIDQVGLVSFADAARTDLGLAPATATNKEAFLRVVGSLATGGRTACAAGVAEAIALLRSSGRPTALPVIVFLTDGMCTHGQEPEAELARAVAEGIAPMIVGIGMVSPLFPAKIARIEGVRFFSSTAFFIDYLEQALEELIGLAASELTLVERLPGYIRYEGEPSELPTSVEPAEGWTIIWRRERLELGETWQVSFAVSAEKTGTVLLESGGELRMKNPLSGAPLPPIPLPEATIRVKNVPPVCGFNYEPAKPTIAEDVNFYDRSSDPFGGTIVSWLWDFGDGTSSSKRNPSHRYRSDGQYLVTLKVTDDEGATCETSQTVTVGAIAVLLTRSALTYPWEQLLPGQEYPVSVGITPKVCINGMGLREVYPSGWVITPVESAGAQFRPPNEWIWLEPLCPPLELKLSYTLAIPLGQAPGRYAISGTATSFSPAFEVRVGGLTSLEVVEKLSIPVAVACLDVVNMRPDPASCYDPQGRAVIKEAQIERAKELYLKGEPVPGAGGAIITYEMMLRLLAYYRTGTPVTEPLPNE